MWPKPLLPVVITSFVLTALITGLVYSQANAYMLDELSDQKTSRLRTTNNVLRESSKSRERYVKQNVSEIESLEKTRKENAKEIESMRKEINFLREETQIEKNDSKKLKRKLKKLEERNKELEAEISSKNDSETLPPLNEDNGSEEAPEPPEAESEEPDNVEPNKPPLPEKPDNVEPNKPPSSPSPTPPDNNDEDKGIIR